MKKFILLAASVFFYSNFFAQGKIINVPADQPTIQSAINSSTDGDTVLVADGTYFENINFKGKAITVASHFLIDGDATHIDSAIINGSQPSDPKNGTVVNFNSGEDTTSILYGLTITGGTGAYSPNAPHPNVWGAGGIAIVSGAKIIYNKIIFNSVTGTHTYVYGGGILVSSPTKPIQIIKNVISNNKAIAVSEDEGGGGGIFCVFVDNTYLLIADNIIANNSVVSTLNKVKGSGGGINYTHSSANPNIRNNLIKNNSAKLGGGIKFTDYESNGDPTLINNTIANNYASNNGGGIYTTDPLIVLNSIFWGNIAPSQNQIFSEVKFHATVEYSNVEGGYIGKGNIDLAPLFADTVNYYLSLNSPCIDAGHPNEIYNDLDGSRNDMGCYGWRSPLTDVEEISFNSGEIPQSYQLSQNYPNPFNPTTKIQYSILEKSLVTIKVYNVLGKEVKTLVNENQNVGKYEVNFDASDLSSGVYFYKLTAGNFVVTKKMILLR